MGVSDFEGFPLEGLVGLDREEISEFLYDAPLPEMQWIAVVRRSVDLLGTVLPGPEERVPIPNLVIAELQRLSGDGSIVRFPPGRWDIAEVQINNAAELVAARFYNGI